MTSDPVRLTPIVNDGRRGRQDLFWRMRRPRFPAHWYAAVLILHLILTVLFCMKTFVSAILAPNSFLVGILFDIPAGFFEGIGWSVYAFPKMCRRNNALVANILLGLLWGRGERRGT